VKLGMVVRDDQGGLGNLTREAWSRLKPQVTCVVQARPCRGEPNPEYFQRDWTRTFNVSNPIENQQWRVMASEADVWWTAETWYCPQAERILANAGRKTVLYAMPELFGMSHADEVWNPTNYLTDRNRLGDVVEWPVTLPGSWKCRTSVRRVLHVSGGAQYDRNGTETFLEALRLVTRPCEVVLHQPDLANRTSNTVLKSLKGGPFTLRVNPDYVRNLKSLLDWADVLVLPRRYAGLCLPAYEAFASGCLVVMPDVAPQDGWPIVPVPAYRDGWGAMKGGRVPMWETDVEALAGTIDMLLGAETPAVVGASRKGREWAEAMSWENRISEWKERLCA
jgi:glycosyltransferase involved in cell wall biosynthesis